MEHTSSLLVVHTFFKDIWAGKAKGFEGYDVIKRTEGLSKKGYVQSDGVTPLQGEQNSINEIILKKR